MPEIHDLQQGADGSIDVTGIVDAAGDELDVTGWAVHAQARPSADSSTLWAEWSTSPDEDQELATPSGQTITLDCPHAASTSWTAWAGQVAVVGIEATEPAGDQRRVSFTTYVRLIRETVR